MKPKPTPNLTGKRYRSVAALVREIIPKSAEDVIRHMRNGRARDRRRAKRLGITLHQLWLKEGDDAK